MLWAGWRAGRLAPRAARPARSAWMTWVSFMRDLSTRMGRRNGPGRSRTTEHALLHQPPRRDGRRLRRAAPARPLPAPRAALGGARDRGRDRGRAVRAGPRAR